MAKTDRAAEVPRVLLVEDNAHLAESTALLLGLLGFDVAVAGDGEAALAAVTADPPDVLVLDVGLPKLDGLEVARRVRGLVPRIAVTTAYGAREEEASAAAGADAFFRKPYDVYQLAAWLREGSCTRTS